jgi:hypothetical protein
MQLRLLQRQPPLHAQAGTKQGHGYEDSNQNQQQKHAQNVTVPVSKRSLPREAEVWFCQPIRGTPLMQSASQILARPVEQGRSGDDANGRQRSEGAPSGLGGRLRTGKWPGPEQQRQDENDAQLRRSRQRISWPPAALTRRG